MLTVEITAKREEGIPLTVAIRHALDGIEKFTLETAKRRIASYMQAGESPEVQWQNQGVAMALNVISDMEAGK